MVRLRRSVAAIALLTGFVVPATAVARPGWGYIDRNGKVAIPFQFNLAHTHQQGVARVDIHTKKGRVIRYIDTRGRFISRLRFADGGDFSEGRAAVLDPKTKKWGYIDLRGKVVIPFRFDRAEAFLDGRAEVNIGGAFDGPEGTFVGGDDKVIDKSGRVVKMQPATRKKKSWVLFMKRAPSGKWGYIDAKGKWVIKPAFRMANHFAYGLAAVIPASAKNWGVIDMRGRLLIKPRFRSISLFSRSGLAPAARP